MRKLHKRSKFPYHALTAYLVGVVVYTVFGSFSATRAYGGLVVLGTVVDVVSMYLYRWLTDWQLDRTVIKSMGECCKACLYPMSEVPGPCCPECGTPGSKSEMREYWYQHSLRFKAAWLRAERERIAQSNKNARERGSGSVLE